MNSDEDAERFVAESDLSEYDWSGAKSMRIVFHDEQGQEVATVTLEPHDAARAAKNAKAEGLVVADYLGRIVHDELARRAA